MNVTRLCVSGMCVIEHQINIGVTQRNNLVFYNGRWAIPAETTILPSKNETGP